MDAPNVGTPAWARTTLAPKFSKGGPWDKRVIKGPSVKRRAFIGWVSFVRKGQERLGRRALGGRSIGGRGSGERKEEKLLSDRHGSISGKKTSGSMNRRYLGVSLKCA
jgi:hypothetical protein